VTDGEDTDDRKLQFFLNSLKRRALDWFAMYETTHPMATWNKVQWVFICRFSEICNESQVCNFEICKTKEI
jgi:hypothetical protein